MPTPDRWSTFCGFCDRVRCRRGRARAGRRSRGMCVICASDRAVMARTWSRWTRARGCRSRRCSCGSRSCACSTTSWSRRASAIAIRSGAGIGQRTGAQGGVGWSGGSNRLPWIPTDAQWRAVLEVAAGESLRNRLMFALAYDAALRREELCLLATDDLDPAHRTLRVRAETTKTRRGRVVPYSAVAGELLARYLRHRRGITTARGALFVSESPRNRAQPITAVDVVEGGPLDRGARGRPGVQHAHTADICA